jgi:hypothetical protein
MKQYDDPNSASTWMVGIISALAVLVTILLLQVFYYATLKEEVLAKQGWGGALEQQRDDQERQIAGSARWIDRENGVVGMPIEMAMERIVAAQQPAGRGR